MSLLGSSLLTPPLVLQYTCYWSSWVFMLGAAFSGFFIKTKLWGRFVDTVLRYVLRVDCCFWRFGHYWKVLLQGNTSRFSRMWLAKCDDYHFTAVRLFVPHMSGIITDLGIMIGARLKGFTVWPSKNKTTHVHCGWLFVWGAITGACLFQRLEINALAFPASFCVHYRV